MVEYRRMYQLPTRTSGPSARPPDEGPRVAATARGRPLATIRVAAGRASPNKAGVPTPKLINIPLQIRTSRVLMFTEPPRRRPRPRQPPPASTVDVARFAEQSAAGGHARAVVEVDGASTTRTPASSARCANNCGEGDAKSPGAKKKPGQSRPCASGFLEDSWRSWVLASYAAHPV